MNLSNLNTKKIMRVTACLLLATLLVTLITASGLFARALFAQRDFSGTIRVELCKPDANGKWQIIDSVEAPASFSASVAELAGGNEVMSKAVFANTSAKGRKVSVKLLRAGKASFELKTGKLVLTQMPFEVTVDGQKEFVTFNLTTESAEGANGLISGKRAQVNGSQASLGVVGSTKIRTDKLASAGQIIKKVEEFQVVIKANGQLTAR